MSGVVIVGGGQAGHQLAISLREYGYDRPIAIIEHEDELPYQRPPLSKDYLFAGDEVADVAFAARGQYAEQGIEFLPGVRAEGIDRAHRVLVLDSGRNLPFSDLVLATGARARSLDVPGSALPGVHTLRSLSDARQLRVELARAGVVVVVGAGFIGLEFATGAAHLGLRVTVLERGTRILQRSLSAESADFLSQQHTATGVTIETGVSVSELTGRSGQVAEVRLPSGQTLPADIVLVGIGVEPNDKLAADAGLAVENGVVVDSYLRTSDPSIFAIGDVARFKSEFTPGLSRVESVQNAMDQARCVARTLTGDVRPYRDLPWFWSQQAGLRLQIAGISTGYDAAYVRSSEDRLKFSVFCYRGDRLVAVESIGQPKIHMQARRLLGAGLSIPPSRAVRPDLDLAQEIAALGTLAAR
jgi:3-phenylpropionate/trans-cinnamate dioxygenase ferredoxin reductase component